jgi:hypothetical protein
MLHIHLSLFDDQSTHVWRQITYVICSCRYTKSSINLHMLSIQFDSQAQTNSSHLLDQSVDTDRFITSILHIHLSLFDSQHVHIQRLITQAICLCDPAYRPPIVRWSTHMHTQRDYIHDLFMCVYKFVESTYIHFVLNRSPDANRSIASILRIHLPLFDNQHTRIRKRIMSYAISPRTYTDSSHRSTYALY